MRITRIRVARLERPLDPPFLAAWDPVPRTSFAATLVRVETDEGVTGIGSGDTMDGFAAYEHLFVGEDPLRIARHVRALETIAFHAHIALHVRVLAGREPHHIVETQFKAFARAFRDAIAIDPRETGVPSTKGSL